MTLQGDGKKRKKLSNTPSWGQKIKMSRVFQSLRSKTLQANACHTTDSFGTEPRCEDTYPDCNLQFLKRSFKADLQQVVNHLGGDDLESGHNMKDTMNRDSVRAVQDP